ncbi:hypothetical protein FRC17_001467 [Serendipita sp. 399]|nr:hypothetical protein FRC17_001467 [Serendipita sp. 399]
MSFGRGPVSLHELTALQVDPNNRRAKVMPQSAKQASGTYNRTGNIVTSRPFIVPRKRALTPEGADEDTLLEPLNGGAERLEAEHHIPRKKRKKEHIPSDVLPFLHPSPPRNASRVERRSDENELPSSDLLKAIHHFASTYYDERGILVASGVAWRKEKYKREAARKIQKDGRTASSSKTGRKGTSSNPKEKEAANMSSRESGTDDEEDQETGEEKKGNDGGDEGEEQDEHESEGEGDEDEEEDEDEEGGTEEVEEKDTEGSEYNDSNAEGTSSGLEEPQKRSALSKTTNMRNRRKAHSKKRRAKGIVDMYRAFDGTGIINEYAKTKPGVLLQSLITSRIDRPPPDPIEWEAHRLEEEERLKKALERARRRKQKTEAADQEDAVRPREEESGSEADKVEAGDEDDDKDDDDGDDKDDGENGSPDSRRGMEVEYSDEEEADDDESDESSTE